MQKATTKGREIKFFSEKNQAMVRVFSEEARRYAKQLETDDAVVNYQSCVRLNPEEYIHVSKIGLRKQYFSAEWVTDFLLQLSNGKLAVREVIRETDLEGNGTLERLEFSRRYWQQQGILDWKIIAVI